MNQAQEAPGDRYAHVYNRLYRLGYHARPTKSHAKALCQRALDRWAPASVLDVGCSLGWSLGFFADHGVSAVGVDISRVAVARARRLGRDARVACASRLPFAAGSFDVVLSTDCLEHLAESDAREAVGEIARVARRGIAIKINPRPDRDKLWRLIARGPLHLTLQPVDRWLCWLEHAGWRVALADHNREEFLLEPHHAPAFADAAHG